MGLPGTFLAIGKLLERVRVGGVEEVPQLVHIGFASARLFTYFASEARLQLGQQVLQTPQTIAFGRLLQKCFNAVDAILRRRLLFGVPALLLLQKVLICIGMPNQTSIDPHLVRLPSPFLLYEHIIYVALVLVARVRLAAEKLPELENASVACRMFFPGLFAYQLLKLSAAQRKLLGHIVVRRQTLVALPFGDLLYRGAPILRVLFHPGKMVLQLRHARVTGFDLLAKSILDLGQAELKPCHFILGAALNFFVHLLMGTSHVCHVLLQILHLRGHFLVDRKVCAMLLVHELVLQV
mmetsp:Transcript_60561/g.169153  ORF Transcript_60561/g.169153 Transcript_60561/m.169153 type:complete len:295 (-) Transcript_60561:269-1153(-)